MKQYHTTMVYDAPVERVWQALTDFVHYPAWNPLVAWLKGDVRTGGQISMFITPLNRAFKATLKRVAPNQELTWVGVQIAPWIIAGEHYYRLERINDQQTRLLHGEYFSGIASTFITRATLKRMEDTFNAHNERLKERVEQ